MRMCGKKSIGLISLVLGLSAWVPLANADIEYRGVNLTGGEYARKKLPGRYGKDYIYPAPKDVDYFLGKGLNTFRLPFLWERLQPVAMGNLDQAELKRIDAVVQHITDQNATVIIDLHNYARYHGKLLGVDVPDAAFADIWRRLAEHYRSNERVLFGLMNEPHGLPTETWVASANQAIAAIRATGSSHWILVGGNAWSGAHSWKKSWYGTPNAEAMKAINDPRNRYFVEAHQYLDKDSSGTSGHCVDKKKAVQRLVDFTDWLRETGKRGFLGEVASGRSDECVASLDAMLGYMAANDDVWVGWTYWAGGPWWGDYPFNLSPAKRDKPAQKNQRGAQSLQTEESPPEDRPQLKPILKHL